MTGAKLQIVRRFRAPPERVFAACTDAMQLARWFAPTGFRITELEADVRVGGRLAFTMVGDDGTFSAEGFYLEIEPSRRIVHSWRWTSAPDDSPPDGAVSRVTYEFEAHGTGTQLTLTHEQLSDQESADSHASGWNEAFDKLAELIA